MMVISEQPGTGIIKLIRLLGKNSMSKMKILLHFWPLRNYLRVVSRVPLTFHSVTTKNRTKLRRITTVNSRLRTKDPRPQVTTRQVHCCG